MKIRVLGGGFYGCHLSLAFKQAGHEVELHEITGGIFGGASGNIPARLHLGFHYPRSRITRAACQEHSDVFMARYGHMTRGVPINIYAIARDHSLVDFDQYLRTLSGEVPFIPIDKPDEYGLRNVEGAVLTGERHIVVDDARTYFERELADVIKVCREPGDMDSKEWDWTIDCTFGSNSAAGVDRYEPCLVILMRGPTDKAITIMDGPFPSLYPWNEEMGLCSLSSAHWTPFSKACKTWREAADVVNALTAAEVEAQAQGMIRSMEVFYPDIAHYRTSEFRISIRAQPLSGADQRLVDVAREGERVIRVRAGKIDAIIHAEMEVKRIMESEDKGTHDNLHRQSTVLDLTQFPRAAAAR